MFVLGTPGSATSRQSAGAGRRDRRRAPLPRSPDRRGRTCSCSRPRVSPQPGAASDPSLERVGILHRADDKVSKYSMGMRQRLGVAACLIGDPELLILDEPMNGLDPAGMQDMREMILSLVAEGRTVVLSSHLLDEVERTCDAVAIVDRGSVVRQGPISELLAGTSVVRRGRMLGSRPSRGLDRRRQVRPRSRPEPAGLTVTLPAGTGNDVIAEINRVASRRRHLGVPAPQHQASLESWFLEVTSRLGERAMTTLSDGCSPAASPTPDHRGSWIPIGSDDQHPFHGAAKAARPHDHPCAGDHRDPHRLPRGPAPAPCPRTEDLRACRRVFRLHRVGRRCAVRVRLHRRGHPRRHRGIRRSHRGNVPPSRSDGSVAPRALSGADPRRARHHHAVGGLWLRHRVRRVPARRADPPRSQRCERSREPVTRWARELGRRPSG